MLESQPAPKVPPTSPHFSASPTAGWYCPAQLPPRPQSTSTHRPWSTHPLTHSLMSFLRCPCHSHASQVLTTARCQALLLLEAPAGRCPLPHCWQPHSAPPRTCSPLPQLWHCTRVGGFLAERHYVNRFSWRVAWPVAWPGQARAGASNLKLEAAAGIQRGDG